ncbi:lytic transglycosylase domain-containing protein [Paracoccus aurantiacus]|uniref:Lytic transglycosylase domain-containing protein n=1 Tax=Paracoccus aurantiacus TaxID=2599412 RepID=A0A5C6S6T7_9RHOB|nr:lytic transglycosylase domain-containing protein [Paracoccus aurantiacus]TXB70599.1 lytic transglycosylase domain-containing protein [Paracoccus aurantiacus]
MIGSTLKKLGFAMKVGVVLAFVGSAYSATPVAAEGLNLKRVTERNRAAQFSRQKQLMDSRLASQYQQSKRLRPTGRQVVNVTTIELSPTVSTKAYSGRNSAYIPHAQAMAKKYGIPESLFLRLVNQESRWNPNARSHKGAMGLAQLMPGTAAKLGVNPRDPVQNLEGGARYLRMMYNQFGDWRLALAAYNAGPGAVQKYGGIPPYRETRNYVRIIAGG